MASFKKKPKPRGVEARETVQFNRGRKGFSLCMFPVFSLITDKQTVLACDFIVATEQQNWGGMLTNKQDLPTHTDPETPKPLHSCLLCTNVNGTACS